MGVTTIKNIKPIIIGDIILSRKIPNLYHRIFKGFNNLELNIPRNKKISEIINDQILISLLFCKGHKAIIKNTIKKTTPKLLLLPIFAFI